MEGWIKIHRKMIEWEWYNDNNTKILFLHLLLTANHKEKKWQGKIIKRGQKATSIQHLAEETNLTPKQVRIALDKLKRTNEVTTKGTNQYTLITIEKYSDYQDYDKEKGEQEGEQEGKQRATNNNDKNIKNIYTSSNDDELKNHFDLTWEIYPNKQGRSKAEKYFLQWVKGRKINGREIKLTDKQMYLAVKKYKKECEDKLTEKQYIKHGSTFFNEAILDYVEEKNE